MIKVEDTISRVIICFLLIVTLLIFFYGFMFTGAMSYKLFERIGLIRTAPDESFVL